MHAFDVLGDPVRRRILELILVEEQASGDIVRVIRSEFGITQPAVSQHLRVLRENGFARVRSQGTRRLYAVEPAPLQDVDGWLQPFRDFWTQRLDAFGTELARGRRARRAEAQAEAETGHAHETGHAQDSGHAPENGHAQDSGHAHDSNEEE